MPIGRVRNARQHLERAGEVDLVEALEQQRADLQMGVGRDHGCVPAWLAWTRNDRATGFGGNAKEPSFSAKAAAPGLIEVLAFPAVQMLDVTGPLQVFATANDHRAAAGVRPTRSVSCPSTGRRRRLPLRGSGCWPPPLPPHDRHSGHADGRRRPRRRGRGRGSRTGRLGARRAGQARRVASVCTGAFLLAASGVLDGRRAATHWSLCAEFAPALPAVRVEPDPIFVRDGAVWTSAGVTAGIDLALALVEEDLGRTVALAVARYLVVFLKRPGGQAQFSAALALQAEDKFGALHDWIGEHLSDDLSLPYAGRSGRHERAQFQPALPEATGLTPARAVERLRVEAARGLLLESRLPVKRIAQRCGFGSEETMRRSFLRLLAATPQEYRARFGS